MHNICSTLYVKQKSALIYVELKKMEINESRRAQRTNNKTHNTCIIPLKINLYK